MINAIKLKKSYGIGENRTEVLKSIDIKISDGDFVAILGASGSGKSTLLNVLSGLERVDSGYVLYDEIDITLLSDAELTKFRKEMIGFIFQQYYLLPNLTIEERERECKKIIFFTKPETCNSAQQKGSRIFYHICGVLLFGNGSDVHIHDRPGKRNIRVDGIYDRVNTRFFVIAPVALRGCQRQFKNSCHDARDGL